MKDMKKREIINGILHIDGNPVFAIGQSYFPSFHPLKVPCPPDRDQFAEMERDLMDIRNAGFNLLRTAANMTFDYTDGILSISTPLLDKMLEKAEDIGLSMQVRIQGYSTNLHGYENTAMQTAEGKSSDRNWANFILVFCFGRTT